MEWSNFSVKIRHDSSNMWILVEKNLMEKSIPHVVSPSELLFPPNHSLYLQVEETDMELCI